MSVATMFKSSDKNDQSDRDERHDALQAQRLKNGLIHRLPVVGIEILTKTFYDLLANLFRLVDIVDLHFDHVDDVRDADQTLCRVERNISPAAVGNRTNRIRRCLSPGDCGYVARVPAESIECQDSQPSRDRQENYRESSRVLDL